MVRTGRPVKRGGIPERGRGRGRARPARQVARQRQPSLSPPPVRARRRRLRSPVHTPPPPVGNLRQPEIISPVRPPGMLPQGTLPQGLNASPPVVLPPLGLPSVTRPQTVTVIPPRHLVEETTSSPVLSDSLSKMIEKTVHSALYTALRSVEPSRGGTVGHDPIPTLATVTSTANSNIGQSHSNMNGNNMSYVSPTLLGSNMSVVPDTHSIPLPVTGSLPLDISIPQPLKEKILANEYVDFSHLLNPNQWDHYSLAMTGGSEGPNLCLQPRKSTRITTVDTWYQAFNIFSYIYLKKFPNDAMALVKYGSIVRGIAKSGGDFYSFDVRSRYLRQHTLCSWDSFNPENYVRAMLEPSETKPDKNQSNPTKKRSGSGPSWVEVGYCFAYHKGDGCSGCEFSHKCQWCKGFHPAIKCFSKQAKSANMNSRTQSTTSSNTSFRPYRPNNRFNNNNSQFKSGDGRNTNQPAKTQKST